MAVNYGGILGNFAGKIGSVVGQVSRGQQIIKAYQPNVNNPKSAKQQAQRKAFATAVYDINKICRDELPFLDKKLGNGKTMYGELVGFATKVLRYKAETKAVPTRIVWDSPLGDFGIDFKVFFDAFQMTPDDLIQGQAMVGSPITNPGEMYMGVPDVYSDEEQNTGVEIKFMMLGLNSDGRFEVLPSDETMSAYVTINPNYVPGGARPCAPQESLDTMEGYKHYVKTGPQMYSGITGGKITTNGTGYIGVWGFFYDNIGNIYSIKQFGVTLRAQNIGG